MLCFCSIWLCSHQFHSFSLHLLLLSTLNCFVGLLLYRSSLCHCYLLSFAMVGFPHPIRHLPVNTKHLYNICTMLDQRRRRWADVVQILYKCSVFAGLPSALNNLTYFLVVGRNRDILYRLNNYSRTPPLLSTPLCKVLLNTTVRSPCIQGHFAIRHASENQTGIFRCLPLNRGTWLTATICAPLKDTSKKVHYPTDRLISL